MKLLITGAAGVLGQLVTQLVEAEGHDLRLTDALPLAEGTPHEFVPADLSDEEQTRGLCDGIEQVLHIAAIHPWKQYTTQQYLDLNIKGTHNIVAEAARARVDRFILTSSVSAQGYNVAPDALLPWDETAPCRPTDSLYSITKHVGEQFCRMYQQTAGLRWLALRPGGFSPRPEDEPAFGFGLLSFAVHRTDVAMAHLLALRSNAANEPIIITAGTTFTRDDAAQLLWNAAPLILRDFPQAQALVEAGIELPERLGACHSIARARQALGYDPQWTFGSWLEKWIASNA
jgi:UDP-glucose 4-epimerase